MIVQLRGRDQIPAGENPNKWVTGPDGTWFRQDPFNPTPWFQFFPEPGQLPPPVPKPKPTTMLALYQAATDRAAFAKRAAEVLAVDVEGVPDDNGTVTSGGILYTPNYGPYEGYGKLAVSLDFWEVKASLSALLYDSSIRGGPSGEVHWRKTQDLIVWGTIEVSGANKNFEQSFDAQQVINSPMSTVMDIAREIGLQLGHAPGQA